MSLEESPGIFKPVPKAEESKEELEGFYHDPAPGEQLDKLGRYHSAPQPSKRHCLLLLLVAALLVAVVIAASQHFSARVIEAVEQGKQTPTGKDQMDERLAEIEAN